MYAIGIDMGGSSAKLAVVDAKGVVVRRAKAEWERKETIEDILHPLISQVHSLLQLMKEEGKEIGGVGLSTPGFLNPERTGIIYAANLPMLNGFPLVEYLKKETGKIIVMDTDVNAGGLAEALLGAGIGHKRVLYVSIGTGLGASLVVEGELVRHTRHGIGHLGHIMIQPEGDICGCGNVGCGETLISSSGIRKIARKTLPEYPNSILHEYTGSGSRLRSRYIIQAAQDSADAAALEILSQFGKWLGLALYNFCAICAPELIVTGGGISEAGSDFFLEKAREELNKRLNPDLYGSVKVKKSHFGFEAGVVGNALNALRVLNN